MSLTSVAAGVITTLTLSMGMLLGAAPRRAPAPQPGPIICITCSDGTVVCGHDPVCAVDR